MKLFTLLADYITYRLFALQQDSPFADGLHFFIEDVSKIFVLLVLLVYGISFLRAGINADRIRSYLQGKHRFIGYLLAAGFGAVTPFCSCSSIPLFIGFTRASIPVGFTFAFLITSPIINEVAVILLGSLLGFRFMVIYIATGMLSGIVGGWFIDAIHGERYLTVPEGAAVIGLSNVKRRIPATERHRFAVTELRAIVSRVWIWILAGIAVGATIHGYVPDDFLLTRLGTRSFWTVPAATLVGIPLYSNASGIIPVAETLLRKGLPLGTTLAFMLSTVAASIPEFILLKQVMKPRLLLIFFLMLLVLFTLVGLLFNILPFTILDI